MFKLPESLHLNKPFKSFIIPCRAVSPMGCIIHITSLDRVLMDIIDLRYHHSICLHKFGLVSFFPYLIGSCFMVSLFVKLQLIQNGFDILFLEEFQKSFGRILLEGLHTFFYIVTLYDHMQMVFEYDIGIELKVVFLLKELEGVYDDLHTLRSGEYRQPMQYRTGNEMRMCRFIDFIVASSHGLL